MGGWGNNSSCSGRWDRGCSQRVARDSAQKWIRTLYGSGSISSSFQLWFLSVDLRAILNVEFYFLCIISAFFVFLNFIVIDETYLNNPDPFHACLRPIDPTWPTVRHMADCPFMPTSRAGLVRNLPVGCRRTHWAREKSITDAAWSGLPFSLASADSKPPRGINCASLFPIRNGTDPRGLSRSAPHLPYPIPFSIISSKPWLANPLSCLSFLRNPGFPHIPLSSGTCSRPDEF